MGGFEVGTADSVTETDTLHVELTAFRVRYDKSVSSLRLAASVLLEPNSHNSLEGLKAGSNDSHARAHFVRYQNPAMLCPFPEFKGRSFKAFLSAWQTMHQVGMVIAPHKLVPEVKVTVADKGERPCCGQFS